MGDTFSVPFILSWCRCMNKKYFKYYCMTTRRSFQPFGQVLWSFSNRDKALSTRIRTFLKSHIFYQNSYGRSLKPLWRAVSKKCARFWFPNSLVSCERKADSLKTVCGLKNIRIRVDVAKQKEIILR